MTTPLLLGVDGGGTSTVALLGDRDGNLLATGRAGPSNCKIVGMTEALQTLERAIAQAFAELGEPVHRVDSACFGLAGFGRAEDQAALRAWAERGSLTQHLQTVTDGDLVIAAGTPDGFGIGVISGTGSIAVGRNAEGQFARAGGWGPLFSDEGSGYAVVLAALRRVARRADGREPSPVVPDPLTQKFCETLGVVDLSGIIPAVYAPGVDRTTIAGWTRLVLSALNEDPTIVDDLLAPAGRDLAEMVAAVARTLHFETSENLPLALAGGFLLSADPIEKHLIEHLRQLGYRPVASKVDEPAQGALVLAKRALG